MSSRPNNIDVIQVKHALTNDSIMQSPPIIKAKLLLEMCSKNEFKRPQYREFAKQIILQTTGQETYTLKRDMNNLGANYSFVNVVFEYITSIDDRTQIIEHLKSQVPHIHLPTHRDKTIVLSDVDDTLFQSTALMGGPKYPPKSKFPGVEKLYIELAWKVVFVTARPPVMKDITLSEFRKKLTIQNVGILFGRTADLLWAAFDRNKAYAKMAVQKYHNFDMISSVYPECRFVWFGDSGQGDLETGRMMMSEKPDQMLSVFIHDVVGPSGIQPKTSGMARTVLKTLGILHIDTYLDAALHLNKLGVLSFQSLFRVAFAASEEWAELSTTGKWLSEDVRTARAKEITSDLEAVNLVLVKNGMATVRISHDSLPESLTPRISPRRKKDLLEKARYDSLSAIEQLKFRSSRGDLDAEFCSGQQSKSKRSLSSSNTNANKASIKGTPSTKQGEASVFPFHSTMMDESETKKSPSVRYKEIGVDVKKSQLTSLAKESESLDLEVETNLDKNVQKPRTQSPNAKKQVVKSDPQHSNASSHSINTLSTVEGASKSSPNSSLSASTN